MATSPDYSTSNQYIKYDITVNEVSTSIPNNTSTVRVRVWAWRTNTGYTTYGTGTCYCSINGTSYSQSISSSQRISYNSDTVLFDKTVTIPHNADGSKTIYVSASISHARFSSSTNGFNVTLSTIPRQATLTAAPDFNDEDNPTITYSNPAASVVSSLQACISLTGSQADIAYRDISISGTSYTFNLTEAERDVLRNACANSSFITVKFIIKTVLSGNTYYSNLTRNFTVVNAQPGIEGAAYEDINPTTLAITGDSQKIIQNISTVRFSFTSLVAKKGATLTSISITANAVTVTEALSGQSVANKTVDYGVINSSYDEEASVTVTDSRGNTTIVILPITMLEWNTPTATVACGRVSNFYSETNLRVTANYSPLDGQNAITIQYAYKEKNDPDYGALATIPDGVSVQLVLDNTKEWNIKVVVSDLIGTTTYYKDIGIGIPILFIDRLLRSVGVGAIPDQPNMFVADRRIHLKTSQHESVADIWATNIDASTRSASLYIYDNSGITRVLAGGTVYGGSVAVRNTSGSNRATMYTQSTGGALRIYNNSDTLVLQANVATYGGALNLYNDSGNNVLVASTGTGNKDGILYVKDENGTDQIWLLGHTGLISCVSVQQRSSRKIKDNIQPISDASKILDLQAVSFDFKDEALGKDKRGFIAEDVAEVLPNLVYDDGEHPVSLDYVSMIPYLQAVIKEQDKRIKALESRLDEIERRFDNGKN